jgi:hypothetical protein
VLGALQAPEKLTGIVEIDGMAIGGHQKKQNLAKGRRDMRASNPKRRYVVTMRERRSGGRSRSFVYRHESEAIPEILQYVHRTAKVRTDEANHWNILRAYFDDVKSVNHSIGYKVKGIHTNWVESFNGRVRRAEKGVHVRISGRHLQGYANEFAWREDNRRIDNGGQWRQVIGAAAAQPVSSEWNGYWQRHTKRGVRNG